MIYLLYGVDTYRSRAKVREIIGAYRAKAGTGGDFSRFDAEEDDLSRLASRAGGASLFGGGKNLVVIERLFGSARHYATARDFLTRNAGDTGTLVVVWDGVVGGEAKKTLAETEALATKTQVFDKLTGDKLLRWIKKESTTRGYALSVAQMAYLAAIGGDDLWAVHNAMEKMAVEPPETRTDNRRTAADATVFQLGDVLFGHPKTALGLLSALLAQGEDEMRIFSYLVGAGRTALVVRSALDAERPVSPAHRIHPFVLKKTATAVRGLTMRETVRRLALFWDADVKIKTGLSGPVDALYRIIVSAMISR